MTNNTNWSDLPAEIKLMAIDNMDIVTRTRLKLCSVSDKLLVESRPYKAHSLIAMNTGFTKTAENELENIPGLTIMLLKDVSSVLVFFKTCGNDAVVGIEDKERRIPLSGPAEALECVVELFCSFMIHGNLRFTYFTTDLDYPQQFIDTGYKLQSDVIHIDCEQVEQVQKWLENLGTSCRFIETRGYHMHEQPLVGLGLIPVSKNAKGFEIKMKNDIDDEQLLSLKAEQLAFGPSKITAHGINQLLKKVVESDYSTGSFFEFIIYNANIDVLMDGIACTVLDCECNESIIIQYKIGPGKYLIVERYGMLVDAAVRKEGIIPDHDVVAWNAKPINK